MSENYFLDNKDLQFRLEQLDLQDIISIKEKGYRYAEKYPAAPRNYKDTKDNWRLLLEVLGDICANRIAPRAAEADEEGAQFNQGEVTYAAATQAAIEALKQAELMGAMLPWEFGGMNMPESLYQMMVEMVSRAEAGLMTIFGLQEIASTINEYADEETKVRVLPRFSRGEVGGAMVLTEADAGSDLGAVQMHATYDEENDTWRLNGVKRFITNGNAEIQVILARSEEGSSDARGLSIFLVERDETVKIRRIENKLGIHSSPTCEIQYNNTPAILIGKRRFGLLRYSMALMNGARLAVGAQALGIAEAAYRDAYKYAGERVQFGKPIRELPAVARMLLNMRGEIEAARALLAETGDWVDTLKGYEELLADKDKATPEARAKQKQASSLSDALTPLVKYFSTEMGNRVCYQAMQIHGGVGYMREFNIERHYRDVRITNIYEGTSQLQVVATISKLLGHALDKLLDEWASYDYKELKDMKNQLTRANEIFKQVTDLLKEKERDLVDYYACDLTDIAAALVTSWLMLQDAQKLENKRELARVYIKNCLLQIENRAETIRTADKTPLEVRKKLLEA
ncbi:MAG: acyl-CoA dehydrogenase family protein [Anaerolineales bacterium]|nr:acyl-CoA dehydrogenase family protein [Anaerolineales bacterium]